jgi:hypothetical protein
MELEAACSLAASWLQETEYSTGGESGSTGGRYSILIA